MINQLHLNMYYERIAWAGQLHSSRSRVQSLAPLASRSPGQVLAKLRCTLLAKQMGTSPVSLPDLD